MRQVFVPALVAAFFITGNATTAHAIHWPRLVIPKGDPDWTVGLRVGPYRPRIADGSTDPRAEVFNVSFYDGLQSSPFGYGPLLWSLEVDYYLLHSFGRLGISASVGTWNLEGYARVCSGGPCTPETLASDDQVLAEGDLPPPTTSGPTLALPTASEPGNTHVGINVVPISVSAVYRADQLMDEWDIPLMPYAKVGLNYHFWWVRTEGETTGEGGTVGWQGTLGLAFNLNWLDPTEASGGNAIGMLGVNLFAEASFISANQFGASPNERLDLSDFTGFVGIAADFD